MIRQGNYVAGKQAGGIAGAGAFNKAFRRWRIAWLVLLPVILLLLVFPVSLQAQFLFVTNGGTIRITGYTGTDGAVTVPGATNGLPVTAIAVRAFYRIPTLVSLTFPSSITNYGWPAVDGCTNLLAVYFQGNAPVDFTPGAPPAFNNVPKTTFYYLQGATGFGPTFDNLPAVKWNPQILGQLSYTNVVGQIRITGYSGPGGAVVIPSTIDAFPVSGLASNAFFNATSLTGMTLPNTVTNIGAGAFANCTNLTSIIIPKSVAGSGVFAGCSALTNVVFHTNITSIAASEFSGCTALRTVTIPGNITSLGSWAFQNCSNLNALYFQSNAPSADPTAFEGANNVTNYYFPKTAGWGATLAGRPTVPILFTVTTNGGNITIFRYIGLGGSVTIPTTFTGLPVTTIGNSAFYQSSSVTNINIGTNITSIAGQAFIYCADLLAINVDPLNPNYSSVAGVLFNKSQTTVLFYPGGKAGSYTIPSTVGTIASYAFQDSLNLTSLTIPASVTSIQPLAFNVDPLLTTIYFQGSPPVLQSFAFDITTTPTMFYLPGMAGWGANFAGFPTALWQPRMQTGDASFGVRTNQFGFNIAWASGMSVVVEACTNLANPGWAPVTTNFFTSDTSYFSDPLWTNHPGCFYRVRWP